MVTNCTYRCCVAVGADGCVFTMIAIITSPHRPRTLGFIAISCRHFFINPLFDFLTSFVHEQPPPGPPRLSCSCTSCVERELSRRKEFSCPIDGIAVKRVTLSTRTLDDVMVEKDTSWRRRVTKVFNKVESDFNTLLEYNNYLEEVEDISK